VRAVVSKRGVDDGNQKGGGSLQPAKENHIYYNKKKVEVKRKNKKFIIFIKIYICTNLRLPLTAKISFYGKTCVGLKASSDHPPPSYHATQDLLEDLRKCPLQGGKLGFFRGFF